MLRDLRYALHVIAKDRWYSAVAVVALALGIGAQRNGLHAGQRRPHPRPALSGLGTSLRPQQPAHGRQRRRSVSFADLDDWRSQSKTFGAIGASDNNRTNLSDDVAAAAERRSRRRSPPTPSRSWHCAPSSAATSRPATSGRAPSASRSSATNCGRPATRRPPAFWVRRCVSTESRRPSSGSCRTGMEFPEQRRTVDAAGAAAGPAEAQRPVHAGRSAACGPRRPAPQAQTEMNGIAQRLAARLSRHQQGLHGRPRSRPSTSASTAARSASSSSR